MYKSRAHCDANSNKRLRLGEMEESINVEQVSASFANKRAKNQFPLHETWAELPESSCCIALANESFAVILPTSLKSAAKTESVQP